MSPNEQQPFMPNVTLPTVLRGPLQSTQLLQATPSLPVATHSTVPATQRFGTHLLMLKAFECTLSQWILLKTFDMGQVLRDECCM